MTADEIAAEADFFSFGTNDLTQMTFGLSRDDAEGAFLGQYLEDGVLPNDPFRTLDVKGVGRLIQMAVGAGRKSKPNLTIGVCGEHGGDPDSIDFFLSQGLDYVSVSAPRVPVARLAAAQAQLRPRRCTRCSRRRRRRRCAGEGRRSQLINERAALQGSSRPPAT